MLVDTLLGGGMSSRLFQEVREKRGLAYSVDTNLLVYAHRADSPWHAAACSRPWPRAPAWRGRRACSRLA